MVVQIKYGNYGFNTVFQENCLQGIYDGYIIIGFPETGISATILNLQRRLA